MRLVVSLLALAFSIVLVGCASVSAPSAPDAAIRYGESGCAPPSPRGGNEWGDEVIGSPTDSTSFAYGVFQRKSTGAIQASDDSLKFVVNVSGEGEFRADLSDPSGLPVELAWGPEPHTGGNIERPGDEWGLGMQLDQPGCWNLQLFRGDLKTADFWLDIA